MLIAAVLVALLIAWRQERLNAWLPEPFQYRTAPAPAPEVPRAPAKKG